MAQLQSVRLTGAVPLVSVQTIAVITAAAEAADSVSAPSIGAQGVYHPAFIDV